MAFLRLHNLSVDFPMYQGGARSLKKSILANTTRGNLARDALNRINVRALDDLNFNIEQGERVALLGLNGAGKTTLLKVFAGIYHPSRGQLVRSGQVSSLLDINVGMNVDLTGYENVILRGMYMGVHPREMRKRVDEIAEFTELGDYMDMPVRTYSSGMKQRAKYACALLHSPPVLILDEPAANLDEDGVGMVREVMRSQRKTGILIVATNDLTDVETHTQQVDLNALR